MQRKLAVLGLALAVLAFGLWFLLSRASSTNVPVADEPAAPRTARASAAVDGGEPEQRTLAETGAASPQARRLCVRSSAGIPLPFVEVGRQGAWVRHELVAGCIAALTEALPTRVRAPGHLERALEQLEGELVLEPDALLLIDGQRLRACLSEVAIEESICRHELEFLEARTRAIAADWISDECFGVAVACDRLEPLPRPLQVQLVRSDRQQIYLSLEPRSGMRERWRMLCDGLRAGIPLEVRVERPAGVHGPVTVILHCQKGPEPGAPAVDVPWGTVAGFSSDLYEERTIDADREVVRFPFALQGRSHSVLALDQTTHAYGRAEFVHDGTSRVVTLREGLEFRGRIVEAESRKPLRSVYVLFQGVDVRRWIIEAQDLKLEPDGSFVIRGPTRVAALDADSLEPPRKFALTVRSPGFDDGGFLVERTDAKVLDAGEIALVRHKNPIVLAAGHAVPPKVLDGQYVVFADKPEELWNTIPGVALEDGGLEIEFAASGEPFDRPLGTTLLAHVVDDVRSFRLGSDGLYHRVPEDSLDLTLRTEALPADGQSWKIGWTWDGAWIGVGQLASNVAGNETQARITIPRGAQQLWWSSSGLPPDLHGGPGGFQAIQGAAMKVVLR